MSLQDRLSALITALGADFKKTTKPLVYSRVGTCAVVTGVSKIPMNGAGTIVEVRAYVNTAPTGAALIVDVNKNGTTIYGTQANRPTIAAGANAATGGTASVTTFAAGDVFSVDIDQVGSTVAGSDLVVVIYVLRTT